MSKNRLINEIVALIDDLIEVVGPDGKFRPKEKRQGSLPVQVEITEEDVNDAIRSWNETMGEEYQGMLGEEKATRVEVAPKG